MIFAFFRTNSKFPRRFWDNRPWILAHEFNMPLPSPLWFNFFFSGNVGSYNPNIPPLLKNKYLAKTHTHIRKRLGRAYQTRVCAVQKFRVLTAWTFLDSEGIWGDKLEPACEKSSFYLSTSSTPSVRADSSSYYIPGSVYRRYYKIPWHQARYTRSKLSLLRSQLTSVRRRDN